MRVGDVGCSSGTNTTLKHSRDMRWQGGQMLSGVLGEVLLILTGVKKPINRYKQTHSPLPHRLIM